MNISNFRLLFRAHIAFKTTCCHNLTSFPSINPSLQEEKFSLLTFISEITTVLFMLLPFQLNCSKIVSSSLTATYSGQFHFHFSLHLTSLQHVTTEPHSNSLIISYSILTWRQHSFYFLTKSLNTLFKVAVSWFLKTRFMDT